MRNRAAGASNQDIELLKRQAMEALQTVQAQSVSFIELIDCCVVKLNFLFGFETKASQLDAQRRHYEGQLQRIAAEAMQREQAALEAAQQSGSASDEVCFFSSSSLDIRSNQHHYSIRFCCCAND